MSTLRRWAWCLWHTRPGHSPYGVIVFVGRAWCAACGAQAPTR